MNPGQDREKIVNIEERIPKIKEQRKQKANRRLISFIMLFFIMVLIIVYLQTPISKVSTISVTGNENVSKRKLSTFPILTAEILSFGVWTSKNRKEDSAK